MVRELAVVLSKNDEETRGQFLAECSQHISVLDTIPHPGSKSLTIVIFGANKAELQEVAKWVRRITGVTVAYWKNDPVDSL